MKNMKKGFTLIELMIVVAIIGILAAIAIPKFADLINKSKEGATKGALSSVRSALQVYYGDNEGWFPTDTLESLIANAKYINEIPMAKLPTTGHADSKTIVTTWADNGGWLYQNNPTASHLWGTFVANCSHEDIKSQAMGGNPIPWSTF